MRFGLPQGGAVGAVVAAAPGGPARIVSAGARRYEGFGSGLGRVPTMAHLPQSLGEASSGPNVLDDPPDRCGSLLAGLW